MMIIFDRWKWFSRSFTSKAMRSGRPEGFRFRWWIVRNCTCSRTRKWVSSRASAFRATACWTGSFRRRNRCWTDARATWNAGRSWPRRMQPSITRIRSLLDLRSLPGRKWRNPNRISPAPDHCQLKSISMPSTLTESSGTTAGTTISEATRKFRLKSSPDRLDPATRQANQITVWCHIWCGSLIGSSPWTRRCPVRVCFAPSSIRFCSKMLSLSLVFCHHVFTSSIPSFLPSFLPFNRVGVNRVMLSCHSLFSESTCIATHNKKSTKRNNKIQKLMKQKFVFFLLIITRSLWGKIWFIIIINTILTANLINNLCLLYIN